MKVRQNILANYLGQGWSALMNIAFVPVYVQYLGIENYALIGVYSMLQAWLALLDLGMSPTLSREMARHHAGVVPIQTTRNLLRSMEVICGLIAIAALAVIAGSSGFVATQWLKSTLPPSTVQSALVIIGAVVALRFCETFYRSALYGLEFQLWYNGFNAIAATLRFGGGACVIMITPHIESFFAWQLGSSIVATAVLAWKVHSSLPAAPHPARFSRTAIINVASFASGMLGINLLAMILSQADKVILSAALPLPTFGFYTLATTICGVIVASTGPVAQAIYPTLSKFEAEGNEALFNHTYHHAAQLIAVAATTIGGMLIVFPFEAIFAWSGNRELASQVAPILRVLAAGMMLNSIMQVPYFATLARGRTGLPVKMNVVAVLVVLPALLIVVPRYGALGAGWIWLLNNFTQLIIGTPLLHRYFIPGQYKTWAWRDTVPIVACGLAIAELLRLASLTIVMNRYEWLAYLAATSGLVLLCTVCASSDLRRSAMVILTNRGVKFG